ncbi:MAG: class I SAM-dependent methyltransferase, partial [Clostridium sp.]
MSYSDMYKSIGLKTELSRLEAQVKVGFEKELRTLKLLGLCDKSKILEIGSGPGFVTERLLEEFENSYIMALEIDDTMHNIARQRLSTYPSNKLSMIKGNVMNMQIKDNFFDFVVVRLVYQHLSDPIKASKEILRVLKPGGKVIITDIDNGIWGISEPELNINKMQEIKNATSRDKNIGRKLLSILRKTGFVNLDFEAVVKHSDLESMEGLKPKIDIEALSKSNAFSRQQLNSITEMAKNLSSASNTVIILILLMASGT